MMYTGLEGYVWLEKEETSVWHIFKATQDESVMAVNKTSWCGIANRPGNGVRPNDENSFFRDKASGNRLGKMKENQGNQTCPGCQGFFTELGD